MKEIYFICIGKFCATRTFYLFLFGAESETQQHVVGFGSQPSQREAEGVVLQELLSTDSRLARLPLKTQ